MIASRNRRAAFWLGAGLVLAVPAQPVQASGTKKVGDWVVITNDREGGRKDVAAVLSDRGSGVGLAIRCIDARLSIALLPLNDEGLFGRAGRAAASFVQAAGEPAIEVTGSVGPDRAVHVSAPAPLLELVLAASDIAILVPRPEQRPVEASFDLTSGPAALADLARQCPGG